MTVYLTGLDGSQKREWTFVVVLIHVTKKQNLWKTLCVHCIVFVLQQKVGLTTNNTRANSSAIKGMCHIFVSNKRRNTLSSSQNIHLKYWFIDEKSFLIWEGMYADISYVLADTNWKDLLSEKQRIFIRALPIYGTSQSAFFGLEVPRSRIHICKITTKNRSLKLGNASKTLSPFAFTG